MRWTRIALVTAGLALAGGVFGTIAGTLVLGTWLLTVDAGHQFGLDDMGFALRMGIAIGGTLGAVLGPLAGWVLMRHVPLWLAVGGTTLGTLATGGLGLLISGNPVVAILLGMFGFAASALALRRRFPPGKRRLIES